MGVPQYYMHVPSHPQQLGSELSGHYCFVFPAAVDENTSRGRFKSASRVAASRCVLLVLRLLLRASLKGEVDGVRQHRSSVYGGSCLVHGNLGKQKSGREHRRPRLAPLD